MFIARQITERGRLASAATAAVWARVPRHVGTLLADPTNAVSIFAFPRHGPHI